jgi:hypothetical protein
MAGCFSELPLNSFLILNLLLDILNRVARLRVQGDGLTGQSLHENLHLPFQLY